MISASQGCWVPRNGNYSYNRAAEVGIRLLLYSSLVKPAGEQQSPFLSFHMSFVQGTTFLNCNKSALWILMKLGH